MTISAACEMMRWTASPRSANTSRRRTPTAAPLPPVMAEPAPDPLRASHQPSCRHDRAQHRTRPQTCQQESELFVDVSAEEEPEEGSEIDADDEAEGEGNDPEVQGGRRIETRRDPPRKNAVKNATGKEVGDQLS